MVSIAIDGPAGAGKSTISRKVAEILGYIYVDTGALYRAIGFKLLELNINIKSDCNIEEILKNTTVNICFVNGEQRVFLDGNDVSEKIRTPEISKMAYDVSAKPEVRAFLLEMQRRLAKENNVIMDGRDIGTVVLPNATIKIYLTASAESRAERRYKELIEKGMSVVYEDVYNDMVKRDFNDANREIAPLKQADDAIVVDTTNYDLSQSIELILKLIKEKI